VSWSNPDVVPVGIPQGPGGTPVTRRRRGWGRVVVGAALLALGIGGFTFGTFDAVGDRDDAIDAAVARGDVRRDGPERIEFETEDKVEYTIFLDGPSSGNDFELEREVGATVCDVGFADGTDDTVRGDRQDTASDIDGLRSIGGFVAPEGLVTVLCRFESFTQADSRSFIVTPGDPDDVGSGILVGVAAAFVGVLGGFVLAWGLRGRYEVG
jgi:hypothetical protein